MKIAESTKRKLGTESRKTKKTKVWERLCWNHWWAKHTSVTIMSLTAAALTLVWTEQVPVELRVGKVLSAFKFRGHFPTCVASERLSAFVCLCRTLWSWGMRVHRLEGLWVQRRFDVSVLALSRLSLYQSGLQRVYEAEQQELDRYWL